MMKKLLVLFCVLLSSISMLAQHRSESEAIQIAQEFFGKKGLTPKLSVVSHQKVDAQILKRVAARRAPAQNQAFYVVNDEVNNRFVIVSADERMYQILGYSDNGMFDAEKMPVALLEMFDGYEKQFDILIEHPESFEQCSPRRVATSAIDPLIKTKWGQNSPYNDDCPTNKRASDGSKCYSGCVATAMAQVMNYHQFPSSGLGSYTYSSSTQKHIQSFAFSNVTFDWGKMVNVYGNDATDEQKSEVAKLMHACGVAVSMDYGDSSDGQSGALPYDIPYSMINYFGYNPNISFMKKDYYSSEEWDAIIMQELEANRPIIYAGYGSGGHCFILDGCDGNGLYHFNFGQTIGGDLSYLDGYGNGYYSLDAIIVKDALITLLTGIEELGNYTDRQNMICHISPNPVGKHEDVFYATSFNISTYTSVKIGNSVNCWFSATNYSSSTSSTDNKSEKFKGEVGIGLYDTNWNFIKSLYSENFNKHSYESVWIDHDVALDVSSFISGNQYFIAPYAKANSSEMPTRIRTSYGKGWYLAVVDGGSITLTKNGEPEHIDYPEIPTGTIFASASGAGDKQFSDTSEKPTVWQLTLTKDVNDPSKYWFDNFDPAVTGNSNRVYGFIDKAGSQLSIPVGQPIGNNLSITNYSNSGDIVVSVSAADSTMLISDAWGTLEASASGDNTTQKQLSFYATTHFSFKPFPDPNPDPDPTPDPEIIISKPLITVDDSKMMSIACSTNPVDIYYTLNGTEPTLGSAKYSSQVPLTGNCTIKAIACKDGKTSETAIYEEKGFIVSKPSITQNPEYEVEMSCSTVGATVYYTIDGTIPTESSIRYEGKFAPNESCVIKAIGIKQNYTNSEIVTFIYSKPGGELVIDNNTAGNLPSRISESEKASTKGLIISGDLNGTDIAFIREMIIKGSLTDLNIDNTNIVSGGAPYYISSREYFTKDNAIGQYMFAKCTSLFSIKLPNSSTVIESNAFDNCDNLKELILPESCESIDNFAIDGCDNLESIAINKNLRSFGRINGHRCPQLRLILVDNNNLYYKSIEGVLYSKDESRLIRFPMGKDVQNYTISDKTSEICDYAMYYCSAKTITIPNSVSVIGSNSFEYCNNIESVIIPNSVVSIGSSAFNGCKSLVSAEISSNVNEIPAHAFAYCPNLRNFSIGAKVTSINEYAFSHSTALQSFVVDNSNETFCSYNGTIYSKNMKILVLCPKALYTNEFRIPDGVTTISNQAFATCSNIQNFYLPSSISVIGNSSFKECEMNSIVIPEHVTSIGESAFYGCKKLETLAIPEGIKRIENWFAYNCDNLTYLHLPSTIEYIGLSAFANCDLLKTIDSAIESIDCVDFKESSLDNKVSAFKNIPDDCTWRVPAGGAKGTPEFEKYANLYKAQIKWWVETWNIIIDDRLGIDGAIAYDYGMSWNSGKLFITPNSNGTINIYSVSGTLVKSINGKSGHQYQIDLPSGMYIINNKKVMLK